jgi:hypothetical protein
MSHIFGRSCLSLILCEFLAGASGFVVGTQHPAPTPLPLMARATVTETASVSEQSSGSRYGKWRHICTASVPKYVIYEVNKKSENTGSAYMTNDITDVSQCDLMTFSGTR